MASKIEGGYLKVSVIIPCYNEEAVISEVVESFKYLLPSAEIHVFDNNSTDNTYAFAEKAGAIVHKVFKRGKGNVVRAMFRDVDAEYYILIDGDGTYPIPRAVEMLDLARESSADMVIGTRMNAYHQSQSRLGHLAGNLLLTKVVNYLFDSDYQDLLSGYRVFSKRFVKSFPLFSEGFEVETIMSVHAVEVDAKTLEIPIEYSERAEGAESKLNTLTDGFKIGWTILRLFKDHKPKLVYGGFAAFLFFTSLFIGVPVIIDFVETGAVPRFPSAILASGLMILSFLSGITGIILSAISKSRNEIKKITFLTME